MRRELTAHDRFLPPVWGDLGLRHSAAEVADLIVATMRRPYRVEPEVTILTRKRNRGARPIARMGVMERVVYRGLVSLIAEAVNVPGRSGDDYDAFEQAPLRFEDVRYVLKTDIASYYEYIDHERLLYEVVAQSADDSAISAAVDLLSDSSGRAFGLPQMNQASDQLAEIYIEPMRRRLVRSGFATARFADDFRVACANYDEAILAWEEADDAARSLGLVLSETKTRIVGIDRYRASVFGFDPSALDDSDAVADGEQDLASSEVEESDYVQGVQRDVWSVPATGVEREEVDPHDALVPASFQPSEVDRLTAESYLAKFATARRDGDAVPDTVGPIDEQVMLRRALDVLTDSGDPDGLRFVPMLLVYEPAATPSIAAYVRRCADADLHAVVAVLAEVSVSRFASAWQSLWLTFVLGDIANQDYFHNDALQAWMQELTKSRHGAVSAEALLSLARRRWIRPADIAGLLDRLPSVHRPTGLIALCALGDERAAREASDGVLDDARLVWALESLA